MARRKQITDPLMPTPRGQRQKEIRASVNAQTAPLIADIQRRIKAQAAAGTRNIAGTSSALQQSLLPMQGNINDIYSRGISELGGLDQRLADRLQGLGGQMGIGDVGQGAAAASIGSGNAELAQMLSQRAAGETYAAKLPGLAQLQGLQNIGILNAQKQRDLVDQTGEISRQVPGLVQNLMSDSDRREVEKGIALRGFGMDQAELLTEARRYAEQEATRRAQLAETRKKNRTAAAQKRRDLDLEERENEQKNALELEKEKGRNRRKDKEVTSRSKEKAKDRRQKSRIEGRKERGRNARNKGKKPKSGKNRYKG